MSDTPETLTTDALGKAIIHGDTKPWPNDIKWVRADLCDPINDPRVKALVDALLPFAKEGRGCLSHLDADWKILHVNLGSHLRPVGLTTGHFQNAAAAIAALKVKP